MNGKKISELAETSTLNDNDVLPVVQDNTTKKVKFSFFKNLLSALSFNYDSTSGDLIETLVDGSTVNLGHVKGDKGERGYTGANAAITGATASVDSGIGTPSVEVTTGGTAAARSFIFAFHNLKGEKGENGSIDNVVDVVEDGNLEPVTSNAVHGYVNAHIPSTTTAAGICSTAKTTSAKTVNIDAFILTTGVKVTILFSNGNSATSPTLNVSGTGAKAIKVVRAGEKITPINHTGYWRGAASTSSEMWQAYTTLDLIYDGTDWVVCGNPIVESYVNGTDGYSVYADGLIEQWGVVTTFIESGDKTTIDVSVHYSSSTSWMGLSWYGASSGNTGNAHTGYGVLIPQNTYQFTTGVYSSNGRISYMVKGY